MNIIRNITLLSISLMMVLALVAPQPARAQWVVSDPGQTALQGAKWAYEKGSQAIFSGLLTAGKVALVNVAKSFFQQLAYDSAVYITSGGAGQKPQLFTEDWSTYLISTGERAAGSFVENLTSKFGTEICPPAQGPAFQQQLSAGILGEFKPDSLLTKQADKLSQLTGGLNVPGGLEIPGLDVSNISFPSINETDILPGGVPCISSLVTNNLSDLEEQFKDEFGNFNQEGFLDTISTFLGPSGNDLAQSVDIYRSAVDEVSNQVRAAAEERIVNQGYKDTASKIAGYIQTPGSFIAEQAFDLTPKKLNATTEQEIAAMSASESLEFILANTAAVFLNTTAQSMIKKLTQEGFIALEQITGGGASSGLASRTGSQVLGGRQQAELAYAGLLTPRITAGGELDILNEFAACPRGFRGQNNCVVDQQFVLAVNAAKQGQPLTIAQAIDKGLLHGDWKLYPPSHDLNVSLECYSGGYCYSNLVKLRRARIIPTGFEIAASLSPKQNPWQLKTVVDGFNACDPATGGWSDEYPFCHLIDPNWILKAPPLRCNAQAFGATLTTAGVNTRQETCVDVQDCPVTDDQGRCLGAWGYCVAEKNTWNFKADVCPVQMAGCQLYTNRAGVTEGLLSTTVSHGVCDESNVGCRRFLNTKVVANGELDWLAADVEGDAYTADTYNAQGQLAAGGVALTSSVFQAQNRGNFADDPAQQPASPMSYFKRAVSQCDPEDKGCTRIIREDGTELHMQIAPDYLRCYDYDLTKAGMQLPFTVEQAQEISQRPGCAEYAPVCAAEELGCQQYTPDAGGTTITGIAKGSDRCSAQCVGYNAFAQEATNFEQAVFPKFFIPSTAQQCSFAAIGCDEFTNLDAQAAGGEGREYYSFVRHCEKPGAVVPNFYTWEGSAQSGFQIQLHHLKADEFGNPAYNTDNQDALAQFAQTCNAQTYGQNPDCREIYTEDGKVSYRLLSKTVTISQECSPLRRAGATQSDCEATGGTFTNGACIYNAIPSESVSCQAQFVGCRAYQGNAGAGAVQVINDTFEGGLSEEFVGFTGNLEISNESLLVGGHSLRQVKGAGWTRTFDFKEGAVYTVSFWAKGAGKLDVRLIMPDLTFDKKFIIFTNDTVSETAKTLTSVWRPYQFGPVQIPTGLSIDDVQLHVAGVESESDIFIDNLVLTEGDVYALIKNSWSTPNACDSDQSDNLPGAALGCQAYTDKNENKNFLKSFSGLCREEAIGCENIIDTRNTEQEFAVEYNTNAQNTLGGKNIDPNDNILIGPDRVLRVVMKTEFLCAQAARGCTEFGFKHLEGEGENTKEVIDSVYLINDPARYDEIVCQAEAVACEAYTSKSGTSYFKDPNILGKKCVFKKTDSPQAGVSAGWYKIKTNPDGSTDTSEPCSPGFLQSGKVYGIWKSSDPEYEEYVGTCEPRWDQCMELIDRTDVDQKTGKPRAYYVIDNEKIDRASCQGRVSRQEGCVLFDDTRNPNKPYSATDAYAASEAQFGAFVTASNFAPKPALKTGVIAQLPPGPLPCDADVVKAVQDNDSKAICFTVAIASIGGLFDVAQVCDANDNLLPAAVDILTGSEGYLAQCLENVAPSNTILKVTRDRQCAAWLSPNSYSTVENPQAGKQKQATGLGLCQAVTSDKGGTAQCADWINPTEHPFYGNVTTAVNYAQRDTSFMSQDLSGLSAMNQFLPYHFRPTLFEDEEGNQVPQVVATVSNSHLFFTGASSGDLNAFRQSKIPSAGEAEFTCIGKPDGAPCGFPDFANAAPTGTCSGGLCTYPINGTPIGHKLAQFGDQACRGFPEEDAPFDEKVVLDWAGTVDPVAFRDQRYTAANVCQDGQNCACGYQKVTYGNGTKKLYYEIGESVHEGVCIGGFDTQGKSKTGRKCGYLRTPEDVFESCQDERSPLQFYDEKGNLQNKNAPLRQDGLCQIKDTKVQNFRGWEGYCLEPDLRTPVQDGDLQFACNSWYPIDAGVGLLDISNQHQEAGYQPAEDGGRYWCAASTPTMSDAPNGVFESFGGSGNNAYTYKEPAMDEFEVKLSGEKLLENRLKAGAAIFQNATLNQLDGIHVTITGHEFGDGDNVLQTGSEFFIGNDNIVRCWDNGVQGFCDTYFTAVKKLFPPNSVQLKPFEGNVFNKTMGIITFKQKHANGDTDFVMVAVNSPLLSKNFTNFLAKSANPWDTVGPDFGFFADGEGVLRTVEGENSHCDGLGLDEGGDGLATGVMVRFDAQGNPAFGVGGICHDTGEDHTPMQRWKVSYLKNSQCTALYPAVDTVNGQEVNYAFTQRLWNKQDNDNFAGKLFWDRDNNAGNPDGYKLPVGTQGTIEYKRFRTPFGSMSLPKLGAQPGPADIAKYKLFTYSQSLQSAELEPPHSVASADQVVYNEKFGVNEIDGFPFSCPDGRCGDFQFNKVKHSLTTVTQAFSTSLNKLFAGWFRNAHSSFADKPGNTYFDVRAAQGRPPRIAALDLATPLQGGAFPMTRIDAFNVNDSDGRLYDATGANTGKNEFVFGIDNLSATVRFAAWADTDQMPLTSMAVDWGDGQITGGATAKYKNRKPYCSKDGGLKPARFCSNNVNVTCESNEECRSIFGVQNVICLQSERLVFGNDPAACEEGFYEFQHIYAFDDSCGTDTPNQVIADKSPSAYPKRVVVTASMLTNENLGGYDYTELRALGVRAGDVLCIYKPKVQVKDNWGWCNGSCVDTAFGGGCLDKSAQFDPLKPGDNECKLSDPSLKSINGHFFDGEIIIVSDE